MAVTKNLIKQIFKKFTTCCFAPSKWGQEHDSDCQLYKLRESMKRSRVQWPKNFNRHCSCTCLRYKIV